MHLSIPQPVLPQGWIPGPMGSEAHYWLSSTFDNGRVWTARDVDTCARTLASYTADDDSRWDNARLAKDRHASFFSDGSAVLLGTFYGRRVACPWAVVRDPNTPTTQNPTAAHIKAWEDALRDPLPLFSWRAFAGAADDALRDAAHTVGDDLATVVFARSHQMGFEACEASWGVDGAGVGTNGRLVPPHIAVEILAHDMLPADPQGFLPWMDAFDAWITRNVDPCLPHSVANVAQHYTVVGTGRLVADAMMGPTPLFGTVARTRLPNAHETLAAMGRLADRFGPLPEVLHARPDSA